MEIKKVLCIFFSCFIFLHIFSQKLITFKASDGLTVTADYYEPEDNSNKFILLFHQADYSRGEHKETSRRLIKLGFNCLAVDLRAGNEVNYVQNETALAARQNNIPHSMLDAEKDIIAAIDYIKTTYEDAEIFLLGSSYSASLCLKIAKERDDIKAVMAFSPGEFFEDSFSVKDAISGLNKPCFVACPKSEYQYVSRLVSGIPADMLTLFKPEQGDGLHGAKTLWWESATRNEYWLALLFFLKDFK